MFKPFLTILVLLWCQGTLAAQTILVLGDSLSAGYGMQVSESWPSLLQERLHQDGLNYKVHNASISGQTTSEGVRQIDQLLAITQPSLVILELGANDGLRGLSLAEMETNLSNMVAKAKAAKAEVLMLGIRVPQNFGRRYSSLFEKTFATVTQSHNVTLIPRLLSPLEAIITQENRSSYIQTDGLHPTALAQPLILDHLYPQIKMLLGAK